MKNLHEMILWLEYIKMDVLNSLKKSMGHFSKSTFWIIIIWRRWEVRYGRKVRKAKCAMVFDKAGLLNFYGLRYGRKDRRKKCKVFDLISQNLVRNSHPEVFYKKVVLKIHKKTLVPESLL